MPESLPTTEAHTAARLYLCQGSAYRARWERAALALPAWQAIGIWEQEREAWRQEQSYKPKPKGETMTETKTATAPTDATILEERPAQPLARLAEPPANGLTAAALASRPKLASALVAAIAACRPAEKDRTNEYHKYAYASSEAIIESARQALSAQGLALIPLEQSVNGSDRTGPDRYELAQKRLLVHASGEAIVCTSNWPICPDKGRPLDKATAAADTLSLSYFLRDLLQMARVDPADEVAGRDDRPQQQPAQKPKTAAKPAEQAQGQKQPAKPAGLPQKFRDWLKQKLTGQEKYANELVRLLGLSGFAALTGTQWHVVRRIVEYAVPLDRVSFMLDGRKFTDQDDAALKMACQWVDTNCAPKQQPAA